MTTTNGVTVTSKDYHYQDAVNDAAAAWAYEGHEDDHWSEHPVPKSMVDTGFVDVCITLYEGRWHAIVYPVIPSPTVEHIKCTDSSTVLYKTVLNIIVQDEEDNS